MRSSKIKNLKGEAGSVYITDTTAHIANFDTVVALSAAVAAIEATNISGDLTAMVLPVGVPIYGKITKVTLASGKVMAYLRA